MSAMANTSQMTRSAGSRRRRMVAVPVLSSASSIHTGPRLAIDDSGVDFGLDGFLRASAVRPAWLR
jgi:NADPH-dependent 2,4-dienoyl-CoA reductase/sulfur reductase-like enzyme